MLLSIDNPPLVAAVRAFASTFPSGERDSADQIAEPPQPDMKTQMASVRSRDSLELEEEQSVTIARISGLTRNHPLVVAYGTGTVLLRVISVRDIPDVRRRQQRLVRVHLVPVLGVCEVSARR